MSRYSLYPDSQLVFADLILRGVAIALLALLVGVIAKDRRQSPAMGFGLALALGMMIYVLQTAPFFQTVSSRIFEIALVALSNGNNALFWFFALALFDDEFRARHWQLILWGLIVCFAGMTLLTHDVSHTLNPSGLHVWSHRILAWLPILFGALTVAAAAKHWRADLVERRRWLRVFIVVAGLLYMLASGVARLDTSDGRLTSHSSLLDVLVLAIIIFVITWRLLTLDAGDLFPRSESDRTAVAGPAFTSIPASISNRLDAIQSSASRHSAKPSPTERDLDEDILNVALERLIKEEQVFRAESLTISRLAARLVVPEYRLRRLINQRLGHRNFNAFLNTYRLQHVIAAMAESKSAHLPILTLALDAGFQSIGPFNRAFKLQFEMTPTEFRSKLKADSGIG